MHAIISRIAKSDKTMAGEWEVDLSQSHFGSGTEKNRQMGVWSMLTVAVSETRSHLSEHVGWTAMRKFFGWCGRRASHKAGKHGERARMFQPAQVCKFEQSQNFARINSGGQLRLRTEASVRVDVHACEVSRSHQQYYLVGTKCESQSSRCKLGHNFVQGKNTDSTCR